MGYSVSGQIVSDLVLTPAAKTTSKSVQSLGTTRGQEIVSKPHFKPIENKTVRKSKTALPEKKVFKQRKQLPLKPIDHETFKANSKKYLEKRFGKIQER